MGLLKFVIKSSLAGGLIYYTAQEGLWSHADESIKFYNKIYGGIAPYVEETVPHEVINELPKLPTVGAMSSWTRNMWNCGVKMSISFIANLPDHLSNGVKSITDSLSNLENQSNDSKAKSDKSD